MLQSPMGLQHQGRQLIALGGFIKHNAEQDDLRRAPWDNKV